MGLRRFADSSGFALGAAVDPVWLTDSHEYRSAVEANFNLCVAENHFKPVAIWKGPREYDFSAADLILDFAASHGLALRGHALLWHQSVPVWLEEGSFAGDEVAVLLRGYIFAVLDHFRGKVPVWDVVNEAISDENGNGLRDTFWLRTLGPDYVETAFRWAREADPDILLYYNDYEAESVGPKSDAVYALISDLIRSGAPIDGVGLQCHFENGWQMDQTTISNIERIESLGLSWQATEVDFRIKLTDGKATEQDLALQAAGYRSLIDYCVKSKSCRGMLLWGVSDAQSWIQGFRPGWGSPLILDDKFQPKPAYRAIESVFELQRH